MKPIWIIAFLLLITSNSWSQTVKPTTVQNLEARFKAGKDTVYVVNFWATWCKPCVKELPYFEKLSKTYKSRPLKILLVNVDSKSKIESSVKPFIRKNNLTNEVVFMNDPGYAAKIDKTWRGALPATLLVNAKTDKRKLNGGALSYEELEKLYSSIAN